MYVDKTEYIKLENLENSISYNYFIKFKLGLNVLALYNL